MRRLSPGMTYEQVVAIIGHPGRPLEAGEFVQGGLVPQTTEKVYVWKNTDGSNMTALFKDRQLNALAQSGL